MRFGEKTFEACGAPGSRVVNTAERSWCMVPHPDRPWQRITCGTCGGEGKS